MLNAEWVSLFFNAVDNRNWKELELMLDENIVYERPGYEPMVGRQDVMTFYTQKRIISSGRHNIKNILINDNIIVCNGSFSGESNQSLKLDVEFCDIYFFNGVSLFYRKTFFHVPCI